MKTMLVAVACTFAALFLFSSPASARQTVTGHLPEAIARLGLHSIGWMPETNRLHLAIGLQVRNKEEMETLLEQIYDPASPNYHHYLTPAEFTRRFGPSVSDYESMVEFAETNGLTVGDPDPGRMLVHVAGSVADINRVFHVHLSVYKHPTQSRNFYAPDTEPSLDLSTSVSYINGLNNYVIPTPMSGHGPAPAGAPGGGSGPHGALLGNDFRAAYAPNVSLTGAGQTIGLLEFDNYYSSDITSYENLAGLSTSIIVTNVYVDGASQSPSNNVSEVSLDIEMVISMAPGASVAVYDAGPNGFGDDMLSAMANSGVATQISSSWFFNRDSSTEQLLAQLALQGQSFFEASGDEDAYYNGITRLYPHAGTPADSTNVTSVGGTTLTTSGPGGFWVSETTWNNFNNATGTNGSGGGVSTLFSIPSWQTNVSMALNGGSTTMRNIPDVAMAADNVWVIYNNGQTDWFWGTSCAAPLWAGFTALVNQQESILHSSSVGLINRAIYTLSSGPAYNAIFHDIITGNNTNIINPNNVFYAFPGYDLCTGWGTPNGMNMINALVASDPIAALPYGGWSAGGAVGGVFGPTNQVLTLTNTTTMAILWAVTNLSPWLSMSATNGSLSSYGSTNISVQITSAANSLPSGLYSGNIVIYNIRLGTKQMRTVTLQVGPDPITFDDLLYSDNYSILAGYGGLYWTNFYCLNGTDTDVDPSGYTIGAVSSPNVVYNGSAQPAEIIGPGPFDLLSAELTAAWRNNLQFEAQGYVGNTLAYDTTYNLSAISPTLVNFNYYGVSRVVFISSGGSPYWGTGEEFAMDNLVVNTHSTPILAPVFQITGHTRGTNVLNWNAQIGQTYQLQFSTNLTNANWKNVGGLITASTAYLSVSNLSTSAQGYYRLEAIQ